MRREILPFGEVALRQEHFRPLEVRCVQGEALPHAMHGVQSEAREREKNHRRSKQTLLQLSRQSLDGEVPVGQNLLHVQITIPHTASRRVHTIRWSELSINHATAGTSDRKAILLATARIIITDNLGRLQAVRALIDQGSEVSLVSEALAQRLRLPRIHSSMSVAGIGGASGATRGKILLSLSSGVTGATLPVVAYVLPRLSSY